MRIYAFQKLPGVPTNNLYLEHYLNGTFHQKGGGTRCYHYELPEGEALAWIKLGIAKPLRHRFDCVQQETGGPKTHQAVY